MKNAKAAPGRDELLDDLISRQELATIFGVSLTSVDNLATRNVITKAGPGIFELRSSVTGYARHLREIAERRGQSLADEKTRLAREQAEKIALQNARIRGELVPLVDVAREWSEILRDVRARMLAIPSRVQARLGHLTTHDVATIDAEVRAALSEAGEHAE